AGALLACHHDVGVDSMPMCIEQGSEGQQQEQPDDDELRAETEAIHHRPAWGQNIQLHDCILPADCLLVLFIQITASSTSAISADNIRPSISTTISMRSSSMARPVM